MPRRIPAAGRRGHRLPPSPLAAGWRLPGRSGGLTLVLIPGGGRTARALGLSAAALRAAGATLALVLGVAVFSTGLALWQGRQLRAVGAERRALAERQQRLDAQSRFFAQEASALARQAEDLARLDGQVAQVLAAAGLPAPGGGRGEGGDGGPASGPEGARPSQAGPGGLPQPPGAGALAGIAAQASARTDRGLPLSGSEPAQDLLAARRLLEAIGSLVPRLRSELGILPGAMAGWEQRALSTPSIWPVVGPVDSGFGWRRSPFGGGWEFHDGIDIGVPQGTPVHATASGVVVYAGWRDPTGLTVVVDHGGGLQTLYGHNQRLLVAVGQSVTKGQVVALSGSTGRSTGPHVHYQVNRGGVPVDPRQYLPER